MDVNESIDSLKVRKDLWDTVEYVSSIFIQALDIKASDIHIEPTEHFLLIRFRIDWDFVLVDKLHRDNISWIITRLKVLSKVKIDENKKPQDWKIVFFEESSGKNIDIRLSTFPTNYWEKVVMRILKPDENLTNIEALWLIDVNLERVREALKSKYWIILVAWPTWSWKSTTLFWVLKNFNPLKYNISTLEDPIEYDIEFVNQSQVRPDIWYTFASWLRTLVRQDPDIIMVWEIRDKETVDIAIEASLTWHLVLSTIHTNSAAETITRVLNMWIQAFLVPASFNIIIAQRLVRRLCDNCKKRLSPKELWDDAINNIKRVVSVTDKKELNSRLWANLKTPTIYWSVWCEKCDNTWYKWRLWLYEVLEITSWVKEMILNWSSAYNINKQAILDWMISLEQDWIMKVMLWQTSLEEIYRVSKSQSD